MSSQQENAGHLSEFVGRGRSAIVHRIPGTHPPRVRKTFIGSTVANALNALVYGAPLDYRWCEAAVRAAFHRRQVLFRLCQAWFPGSLRVVPAAAWNLDATRHAYHLDMDFVEGHTARAYSPFHAEHRAEFTDLRHGIMPRLQKLLREAGFVGSVWQAGLGQPCAITNFLCLGEHDASSGHVWAWVDLESGVPAIASYRPRALFGHYLPQAIRRRRMLFDDLDATRLETYLSEHEPELREHMGDGEWMALRREVDQLVAAHAAWSRETRFSRSLGYARTTGRITDIEQADYQNRPLGWYTHLASMLLQEGVEALPRRLRNAWRHWRSVLNPVRWVRFFVRIVFQRSYRIEVSRTFARRGIEQWRALGRIDAAQADTLERELLDEQVSQYLADFGVHLAMKPLGYAIRPLILWAGLAGVLPAEWATLLFVFCGLLLRSIYVLFRTLEDLALRRRPALVAMLVAPVPTVGSLAYACQMLHTARTGHLIAQFIIYETCSAVAAHIPIWGGRDSEWDYFFNRVAHGLIHLAQARPQGA